MTAFDTGNWTPDNLGSATAFDRATRQWVTANDLVKAIQDADNRNAVAVAAYNASFAQYSAARDANPAATNIRVPVPAIKYVVVADAGGFPIADLGTELVCAVKQYVPPVVTPSSPTGALQPLTPTSGVIVLSPPADTLLYAVVSRSDGTKWQRVG